MTTSNWLSIASLIISCIGIPSLTALMLTDMYNKKKQSKKESSDIMKKAKQTEFEDSIRVILHEEIMPLSADIKDLKIDSELTKQAVQATLRHDLYELADKAREDHCCPDYIKQDFDNMYEKYHQLGKNGVMDTIYAEIMSLPSSKENGKHISKRKRPTIKASKAAE